jgi:hypothetical protein
VSFGKKEPVSHLSRFFLTALRQWMRIDNKITIKKHYDAESPLDLIEAALNFTTAWRES